VALPQHGGEHDNHSSNGYDTPWYFILAVFQVSPAL